jgi:nucleoside-diphosphate-sugar epimerase
MKHLFCFGLGYSALTLAKQLLGDGWRVSGTCRNSDKCEQLRSIGITAYIFDNDLPLQEIWDLQTVTHILHSIPPDESGDPVILQHLAQLQNLNNLEWFGYLSTTGVYGNHEGRWVDEETPLNPPEGRNRRRAESEKAWLLSGLPAHIFRLSGIYGKGRSIIEELKAGTAHRVYKEQQVFSRIHVEDIAQILLASINNPNPGCIYNCADNEPAPQHEVVEYAAEILGVQPPPIINLEEAELSEMARSFWQNNRRVKNDRIKNEHKVKLKYPSYREGLRF